MRNVMLFLLLLSVIFNALAQDLTISFQPKVSGTPIDSIRVTNLRTNQSVKLTGSETLLLVKPTGINPMRAYSESGFVFSNPTDKEATLRFFTNKSQEVEISLFNVIGQLLGIQKQSLKQGMHQYQLNFPIAGVYYVSVNKIEGNESFKVVYYGEETQSSSIVYSGSENFEVQRADVNYLKSANASKTLTYKDGDVIQYSFSSGKNTTIVADIPKSSKALDIEFVSCIDKDNRSYKVVKIGTQWWMAENLAYLPMVSSYKEESTADPFCYVYDYNGADVAKAKANANYTNYGVLYNWSAALTSCPSGWHLPTDADWKKLEIALGMTATQADATNLRGSDQGFQMKASYGWKDEGNGTNASGFNAFPGGFRFDLGGFTNLGRDAKWWSSTEYDSSIAWARSLRYENGGIIRTYTYKKHGYSVRCVKD